MLGLQAVRKDRIPSVQGTGHGQSWGHINSPGLRSTGGVTAASGKREDSLKDLNLSFQPLSPSHSSATRNFMDFLHIQYCAFTNFPPIMSNDSGSASSTVL